MFGYKANKDYLQKLKNLTNKADDNVGDSFRKLALNAFRQCTSAYSTMISQEEAVLFGRIYESMEFLYLYDLFLENSIEIEKLLERNKILELNNALKEDENLPLNEFISKHTEMVVTHNRFNWIEDNNMIKAVQYILYDLIRFCSCKFIYPYFAWSHNSNKEQFSSCTPLFAEAISQDSQNYNLHQKFCDKFGLLQLSVARDINVGEQLVLKQTIQQIEYSGEYIDFMLESQIKYEKSNNKGREGEDLEKTS